MKIMSILCEMRTLRCRTGGDIPIDGFPSTSISFENVTLHRCNCGRKLSFSARRSKFLVNRSVVLNSGKSVSPVVCHCQLLYLTVNCWPNEFGSKCDVNIEYSLENTDMELNDVVISIPLAYVHLFVNIYRLRSRISSLFCHGIMLRLLFALNGSFIPCLRS